MGGVASKNSPPTNELGQCLTDRLKTTRSCGEQKCRDRWASKTAPDRGFSVLDGFTLAGTQLSLFEMTVSKQDQTTATEPFTALHPA